MLKEDRERTARLSSHEATCVQLRRGVVSCHQLALSHQHSSKIHHANASLLTTLLFELPTASFASKSDKELVVYPQALDYPVPSEHLIRSLPPQVPITPITPAQSDGGGGGGTDSHQKLNAIQLPAARSMSRPSSSTSLTETASTNSVKADYPAADIEGQDGEQSALRKRKLGKVGIEEAKEERPRHVSCS
ncbi:hypothetical protein JCM3765_002542 [Sporobolomyces pararoseus]